MARKTRLRPCRRRRRTAEREAALVRRARRFMRMAARQLAALLPPARALRRKLTRTDCYRKVAGTDDAEQEPAFDLAGTLEVMLERDLEEMIGYLRAGALRRSPTRE